MKGSYVSLKNVWCHQKMKQTPKIHKLDQGVRRNSGFLPWRTVSQAFWRTVMPPCSFSTALAVERPKMSTLPFCKYNSLSSATQALGSRSKFGLSRWIVIAWYLCRPVLLDLLLQRLGNSLKGDSRIEPFILVPAISSLWLFLLHWGECRLLKPLIFAPHISAGAGALSLSMWNGCHKSIQEK